MQERERDCDTGREQEKGGYKCNEKDVQRQENQQGGDSARDNQTEAQREEM